MGKFKICANTHLNSIHPSKQNIEQMCIEQCIEQMFIVRKLYQALILFYKYFQLFSNRRKFEGTLRVWSLEIKK